jgi:hypothetical protein
MTFFEFLYDIYIRVHKVPFIERMSATLITVERDQNNDNLFIFFRLYQPKIFVYGVYKKSFDITDFDIPNPLILSYSPTLVDSLKQLKDEADNPHIETHIKLVDDYVCDSKPYLSGDRKKFGISIDTKHTNSRVSSREFHSCGKGSRYFAYVNVQDHISKFSTVDFSVNFNSNEVKKIVGHFDEGSIVKDRTSHIYKDRANLIYFRRNSKGKLFLEARDIHHSYSVHTDHDIGENTLYIPIRIRIREFIFILKLCSEKNNGVVIDGKGYSTEHHDSYLKIIDEDDFSRYEYWFPYEQSWHD